MKTAGLVRTGGSPAILKLGPSVVMMVMAMEESDTDGGLIYERWVLIQLKALSPHTSCRKITAVAVVKEAELFVRRARLSGGGGSGGFGSPDEGEHLAAGNFHLQSTLWDGN
ncbi:disease resistance protein [Striga asiatica]|uniref:Disease resistance protein n=1 Tax=Striga asiatica TaxID=4170 RepID=A0A5A7PUK2_STRAF|nr:disease resistance protein [Striga asiatica]